MSIWQKHPESVEMAKEEWQSGKSSCEIANILTAHFGMEVTRCMVIGKMHRLGLGRIGASNLKNGKDKVLIGLSCIIKLSKRKIKPPKPLIIVEQTPNTMPDNEPVAVVMFDPLVGRFPRVMPWQLPAYGQCKYIVAGQDHNDFICTHEAERRALGGFTSWCRHHAARVHKRATDATTGAKETAVG